MSWLEDAQQKYQEIAEESIKRKQLLSLHYAEDLPADISEIRSVILSVRTSSQQIIQLAAKILREAPLVEKLHFGSDCRICWNDLLRLDLSSIKELTFTLDGPSDTRSLSAPSLKTLTICGIPSLTPLELMISPPQQFDFSCMPNLEKLTLKNLQKICPDDFKGLTHLKELGIYECGIIDLDWLQNAKYHLSTLVVDDPVSDCSGLCSQSYLYSISLLHSDIIDGRPFLHLPNLHGLDIRNAPIRNEAVIRNLKLDDLLITQRDLGIYHAKQEVRRLLDRALRELQRYEAWTNEGEGYSLVQRLAIEHYVIPPYPEGLQNLIRVLFNQTFKSMCEDQRKTYGAVTKEEYLEAYKRYAKEYFPFL